MDKKTRTLTLLEKYSVIKMVCEEKRRVREVMAHFKCGKTQIYNTIKQKDKIIERYSSGNQNELTRKREHKTKYFHVNNALYEWYRDARQLNMTISGPILQQKAKEIAGILNMDDFSASNGWLESFRKRYGIFFNSSSSRNICRGSNRLETDPATTPIRPTTCAGEGKEVENWQDKLMEMTREYLPKDIASVVKTGLYYRAVPEETFRLSKETCYGGELARERLTVLLTVFADGNILKPIVVGREEQPQCFKNLGKDQLPVEYRWNRKALMTSAIFVGFLCNLNEKLIQENRRILLFVESASCHPDVNLSNIHLIILPPCTAMVLQPLNNGIAELFKINYRRLFLCKLRASMDTGEKLSNLRKHFDELDALFFLIHSVKNITEESVKRSFQRSGFWFFGNKGQDTSPDANYSEIQSLMNQLGEKDVDAKSFVNLDQNVSTEGSMCDTTDPGQDGLDNCSEKEIMSDLPKPSEFMAHLDFLKNYAVLKGESELYSKTIDLQIYFQGII